MKILILNYEYPPLGGGAANATKYILKEFSKFKELEIDLVTSSIGEFKIETPYKNITIHYLDIGKNPNNLHSQSNRDLLNYSRKAYSYSKKLNQKKNFDLCHAFFGIPCGYIAMKLNLPYIVSLRGSDVPFYSKKYKYLDILFFKKLSKNIWKNANFVIANSKGLKELANQSAPNQEIKVIYNGIDTKEFFPKKKNLKTKKTKNKLKILSVGRLIERKGFSYLIDAIKPLKTQVELTIVGDGPLKKELELLSKGTNTKFLGILNHDELPKIYSQNDIFVLPSFNEGMSNTVLEAISAGLGVIVSNTGGTAELVKGNGFIIETGNSKQITLALEKYLADASLIKQHSKKSREMAIKMSWENVAKDYLNYYLLTLNKNQNLLKNKQIKKS